MRVAHRLVKVGLNLVLVAGAALAVAPAVAAPLRNVPQTLRQPDGTVVHLFASGDEYYNRLHDAAGFTVVRDPDNGYLVYAMKIDGRLQPTGFVVGKDDPAAAGLTPDLMPDPRTLPSADELYPMTQHHAQVRAMGLGNAPAFSAINNLVVFIRFADDPELGFQSLETYKMWFNSGSSSLEKYFLEASYGKLTIDSTFYPTTSGSTVASYQDRDHNRSYYKPYDPMSNPPNLDGYQAASERNVREWTLLQAAASSIASQVPVGLDLDTNHDGYIDSVVFVVSGVAVGGSGPGSEWGFLLWPHRWAIGDTRYQANIHGKLVGDYDLQLDGNIAGSGVLCHEMTHTLGAPDLYHYPDCPSPNDLDPVGQWDLMASNLDPPQQMSAYLKWRYLGFIWTIPTVTAGSHTLNPLTSATDNCYRIASPNSPSQYFVVEYRKRSSPFDLVPGSGLLVYRIDTTADGRGNQCGPPDEVYVYRPGGSATSDGLPRQAYFTSDTVPPRTAINDTTDPAPVLSDGFPGGLSIHDVGAAGSTISFTVDNVAACTKPGAFTLASPANGGSVAGSSTATLEWDPSAGATSYDVYFGTDLNPPLVGNQSGTNVTVNVRDNTTYFWRVAAKNACAQTLAPASGTWAFVAGSASGGITIFSDDFEGDFPGHWTVSGVEGHAGAAMWGKESCNTKGGTGAVWCAAGGTAQPACSQYVQDHGTFLIYGPVDLSDAAEATLDFDTSYDINDGGNPTSATDSFEWLFSVDGKSFSAGDGVTGTSDGWTHVKAQLSQLTFEDGSSVVGKPKVWLGFVFVSSPTTTPKGGAYIDNVVIKKMITKPPAGTGHVRRHLPRR